VLGGIGNTAVAANEIMLTLKAGESLTLPLTDFGIDSLETISISVDAANKIQASLQASTTDKK
jgi:hypothetical protein